MKRLLLMSVAAMCCGVATAQTNELFTVENGKIVAFCGYRFGELKPNEKELSCAKHEVKGLPNWGKCHIQFKYSAHTNKSSEKAVMHRAFFSKYVRHDADIGVGTLGAEIVREIKRISAEGKVEIKSRYYALPESEWKDGTVAQKVVNRLELANGYIMYNCYEILGYGSIMRVEAAITDIGPKNSALKDGDALDFPCTNKLLSMKDGRLISFLGLELGETIPKECNVERSLWGQGYVYRKIEVPVYLPQFKDLARCKYGLLDDKLNTIMIEADFDVNDNAEQLDILRIAYKAVHQAIKDGCGKEIKAISMEGGIRWKLQDQDIYLAFLEAGDNGENVKTIKIYAGKMGFESDSANNR